MTETIIPLIIATLTPFVVAAIKLYAPRIPTVWLPIIAAITGPALDVIAALSTSHGLDPVQALIAGLAGVGLREIKDQVGKAAK